MNRQHWNLWLLAAAIPLIAWLPLPDFWIVQLNYIGLYALVCLGLVLLTGVGGLTSLVKRLLWALVPTPRRG